MPRYIDQCSVCGQEVTRLLRVGRPPRIHEAFLIRDTYEGTTTHNGRWVTSCHRAKPVAAPVAVEDAPTMAVEEI